MEGFSNPTPKLLSPMVGAFDVSKSDNGEYTKKDSVYFAFIDILGFKRTIDDELKQGKNEFEEKCKRVFEYYFNLIEASCFRNDTNHYYAGQISDSLYFHTTKKTILISFIQIFSYLNIYAMSENVFFRGGIAKGDLFTKAQYQFYGNSVIYAYLLESVVAKKPAIYLAENVYNELVYTEVKKFIDDRTELNRYFITPFAGLDVEIENVLIDSSFLIRKKISHDMIDLVGDNIKENKMKFEYDKKNFEKYIFLMCEYNGKRRAKNE